MSQVKVTITLEFEGYDGNRDTLREMVYTYLEEAIEDDTLSYTVTNLSGHQ